MRFTEEAPAGTMEFLFISVILKLKDRGFDGFSLGTAPLVGLDRARHKRLWDHLGGAVSTFGGRFYNFEGLRDYKKQVPAPVGAPLHGNLGRHGPLAGRCRCECSGQWGVWLRLFA